MLLITDSLGLHKICSLKKTSSKGALFAFWVKIISKYEIRMVWQLNCTEVEIYKLIHTHSHAMLMLLTLIIWE